MESTSGTTMADEVVEVQETWEDFEDTGELDKRIQDLRRETKPECNSTGPVPLLMEDSSRTAYQPQIKILKRKPNSSPQPAATQNHSAPPRQYKTLEQREAEYAEARLRILGDAGDFEDEDESSKQEKLVNNMEGLRLSKSDNSVIRQPKGPDGTKGFHSADAPR